MVMLKIFLSVRTIFIEVMGKRPLEKCMINERKTCSKVRQRGGGGRSFPDTNAATPTHSRGGGSQYVG